MVQIVSMKVHAITAVIIATLYDANDFQCKRNETILTTFTYMLILPLHRLAVPIAVLDIRQRFDQRHWFYHQ